MFFNIKKLKKLKNVKNNINPIILSAFLTGIALVISSAWGDAIKKTITLLVNKIRCSNYSKKQYEKCSNHETLISLYINAILTSIIVLVIVHIIFGNHKPKHL